MKTNNEEALEALNNLLSKKDISLESFIIVFGKGHQKNPDDDIVTAQRKKNAFEREKNRIMKKLSGN